MRLVLDPAATRALIFDPAADRRLILAVTVFEYFPPEEVFCVCVLEAFVCELELIEAFGVECVAAECFAAGVECFDPICCEACE